MSFQEGAGLPSIYWLEAGQQPEVMLAGVGGRPPERLLSWRAETLLQATSQHVGYSLKCSGHVLTQGAKGPQLAFPLVDSSRNLGAQQLSRASNGHGALTLGRKASQGSEGLRAHSSAHSPTAVTESLAASEGPQGMFSEPPRVFPTLLSSVGPDALHFLLGKLGSPRPLPRGSGMPASVTCF